MRRLLLILFGVLIYNIMSAQVTITTDTTSDKFKIQESTYITDMPLGSVYVDVNSSGHIGLKILGTDKLIVGYKTPATYTINGVLQSNKDTCVKYLSLATSLQLEYLISNISGGGGTTLYAGNGILIENDTIKLDSVITQPVHISIPDTVPYQVGTDGDAINLNVPLPTSYGGLANTFTGFDYNSPEYKSFIGVLKGVNFPPIGFFNQDMVGTFAVEGDPFDTITPDGNVFVDGVWDEGDGVTMTQGFLGFSTSGGSFNSKSMGLKEQKNIIVGDDASQSFGVEGNNGSQDFIIIGDSSSNVTSLSGEGNIIQRIINDTSTNKLFHEIITDTKYSSTVDTFEVNADVINLNGALYVNHEVVDDSTLTLGGNKSVYIWNIPSPSAEATLNFPSTPLDGTFFRVIIGATDTLGHTISNGVSFYSSNTLYFTVPSELKCGEVYEFQYFSDCNCWYQIK